MTRQIQIALVSLVGLLIVAQLFARAGGVGFVTAIVVFLIAWWTILFMVLPLRVQGQFETGEIEPGSEPGAPADPKLGYKAWLTTVVTSGLWLVYYIAFEFRLISLEAIPFLMRFEPPA